MNTPSDYYKTVELTLGRRIVNGFSAFWGSLIDALEMIALTPVHTVTVFVKCIVKSIEFVFSAPIRAYNAFAITETQVLDQAKYLEGMRNNPQNTLNIKWDVPEEEDWKAEHKKHYGDE